MMPLFVTLLVTYVVTSSVPYVVYFDVALLNANIEALFASFLEGNLNFLIVAIPITIPFSFEIAIVIANLLSFGIAIIIAIPLSFAIAIVIANLSSFGTANPSSFGIAILIAFNLSFGIAFILTFIESL